MSETHRPGWVKPLDPSLYVLDEEEKTFMKATTGIQDEEEVKAHVVSVQTKAFAVCISPLSLNVLYLMEPCSFTNTHAFVFSVS